MVDDAVNVIAWPCVPVQAFPPPDPEEDAEKEEQRARVGPGRYCSCLPRHWTPLNENDGVYHEIRWVGEQWVYKIMLATSQDAIGP